MIYRYWRIVESAYRGDVNRSTRQLANALARLLSLFILTSAVVCAQAPFPMRYLDEVGHLGTDFDSRKSVDLGLARVLLDDDALWFEGRDRAGKPWRIGVDKPGLVGSVDVWTADFDHNGQADLLIAPFMPQNGRCAFGIGIMILLFDRSGRPTAWGIDTQMPDWNDPSPLAHRPALVTVLKGDRHAEFVSVHCEYDYNSPGLGTNWTITGVYEARDARLIPMMNIKIGSYERAVKEAYPHGPEEKWLPMRPGEWPSVRSIGIEGSALDGRK